MNLPIAEGTRKALYKTLETHFDSNILILLDRVALGFPAPTFNFNSILLYTDDIKDKLISFLEDCIREHPSKEFTMKVTHYLNPNLFPTLSKTVGKNLTGHVELLITESSDDKLFVAIMEFLNIVGLKIKSELPTASERSEGILQDEHVIISTHPLTIRSTSE